LAIPLNDVKQNGQNVEFGIKVAHASFQGTLNQAGTELAGKLIHEGVGTAMTLKRAIMAGAADNPFIGTWKLNLQKSRFSNPAPKSSTITFFAMENGMIFLLETVDSTGKVSQFRAAEPFDGEVKGESVIPGATVTGTRVDSNTVVLVFKKDGNEVRRVTENASKDGKTLTRTRKEKNTEGIELEDIAVFEKQQ
jgi:hypothetical protein